jgi:hypothetical protein
VRGRDAARFCNWLQNGQPRTGAEVATTTEQGAYTLNGDVNANGTSGAEQQNTWANWWIPSEDEWYKPAYYDPALGGGTGGYWSYATRSNTAPGNDYPDASLANQANYLSFDLATLSNLYSVTQSSTFSTTQNYLTPVGSFSSSAGAYGTYDQAGDVWNWTSTFAGSNRVLRGGSWYVGGTYLQSNYNDASQYPSGTFLDTGFRVAAIANPANTYIGDWAALVEAGFDLNPLNGLLHFNLAPTGTFSATLALGQGRYAFKSMLESDGTFSGSITPPGLPPVQVSLALESATNGMAEITGTVSSGANAASFVAEREVFSTASISPQAGRYTALMSATSGGPAPAGCGYATLTVGKTGGVSLLGKLPDGDSVSSAGTLVAGAAGIQLLVYESLGCPSVAIRGARATLMGVLTFEKLPGSDFDGTLAWVKPQQTKGGFPAAVDTPLTVVGSLYDYTRAGSILAGFTSGTLELSDTGALSVSGSTQVEQGVMLTPPNRLAVTSPDPAMVKITVHASTGTFTGSFFYPQGRRTTFGGVFFQDLDDGGGLFVGADGSGEVQLLAPAAPAVAP